jgi:hypothetical protein
VRYDTRECHPCAEERQELKHKLGSAPVKPRLSSALLALRQQQATLAKAGRVGHSLPGVRSGYVEHNGCHQLVCDCIRITLQCQPPKP